MSRIAHTPVLFCPRCGTVSFDAAECPICGNHLKKLARAATPQQQEKLEDVPAFGRHLLRNRSHSIFSPKQKKMQSPTISPETSPRLLTVPPNRVARLRSDIPRPTAVVFSSNNATVDSAQQLVESDVHTNNAGVSVGDNTSIPNVPFAHPSTPIVIGRPSARLPPLPLDSLPTDAGRLTQSSPPLMQGTTTISSSDCDNSPVQSPPSGLPEKQEALSPGSIVRPPLSSTSSLLSKRSKGRVSILRKAPDDDPYMQNLKSIYREIATKRKSIRLDALPSHLLELTTTSVSYKDTISTGSPLKKTYHEGWNRNQAAMISSSAVSVASHRAAVGTEVKTTKERADKTADTDISKLDTDITKAREIDTDKAISIDATSEVAMNKEAPSPQTFGEEAAGKDDKEPTPRQGNSGVQVLLQTPSFEYLT